MGEGRLACTLEFCGENEGINEVKQLTHEPDLRRELGSPPHDEYYNCRAQEHSGALGMGLSVGSGSNQQGIRMAKAIYSLHVPPES